MSQPFPGAAFPPPASIVEALREGHSVRDREFDSLYPEPVRRFSARYFTPVDIARHAARFLTAGGAAQVLDIGAGVGKFCLIGAITTGATFVGIEHRKELVEIGAGVLRRCGVQRVALRHGAFDAVRWRSFGAIYLYNPFEENLVHASLQIDQSVSLSCERFERDVARIEEGLRATRIGTRVVTYHGFGGWMPESYELVEDRECGMGQLHFWVKVREEERVQQGKLRVGQAATLVSRRETPHRGASRVPEHSMGAERRRKDHPSHPFVGPFRRTIHVAAAVLPARRELVMNVRGLAHSVLGFSVIAAGCGGSGSASGDGAPTSNVSQPVCGDTHGQYPGDEYCILPPPADQGFQIHYGPSNYDDPDEVAKYLMMPGQETNIYVPVTAPNDVDIYYYKRQYRMRPGSHHLIISEAGSAAGFAGAGRRLGGSQNVSKDNPSVMAPENEGIGMPLAAHAALMLNLHHFNSTSGPILKEAWVNFWYVDPSTVTQVANEIFLFAPGSSVPPGGEVTFHGSKSITQDGRVLTLYGHRHESTLRFTAYRTRAGQKELVYQDFDWAEPGVAEFNTVTQNPPLDPNSSAPGAESGDLDLQAGDTLEWECQVKNEQPVTISYGANEVANSEMCILVGDALGPALTGFAGQ